jgi:anti-sigma-K factor RskA
MPEPAAHPVPHPDLGGYVVGCLSAEEADTFDTHLASCAVCRDEVRALAGLPALLEQASPPVAVPAELARRTRAAVEAAAAGDERRRVFTLAALSAVAVLIVLLAAAVIFWPNGSGSGPPPTEFALVGVGGSTATAQAVAVLDEQGGGWVIDLDVSGLAPPPEGSYYECWYVGAGDTRERPNRISAGTFVVGDRGSAALRMTLGARLREYPTMTVSLEPDDGDPAWSGPEVLKGTATAP